MRRDLLLSLALFAGISAQAVTSPYTGSTAAEGVYYLYQVETGQWLQTNRHDFNQWTTYGSLDDVGFDVQLVKPEGFDGYQIFCRFTNNGSLNGADQDRFFLDQADRDVTDWIFVPVTVDGVSNAYRIMAKATPEGTNERSAIANDIYIGASDGQLSDNPEDYTWQLVSREERLKKMVADAANGPVDATWLIPWNDLGRNDMRDREWQHDRNNPQGGAESLGGSNGYPVWEYWHYVTMHRAITLTDLPNGTYNFTVQAYYRDGEIDDDAAQRWVDGEEVHRATYFAGASKGNVMSIFDGAKDAQTNGYDLYMETAGKWVPNTTSNAAQAMFDGNYINSYIQAAVTDGTLTIGIDKPEGTFRDWLITKRMYLQYAGTDIIAEDLSGLRQELSDLITKGEGLPQTPGLTNAIATGKERLTNASSATALLKAIDDLKKVVTAVEASKDIIKAYNDTKALGVRSAEADEMFNNATSKDDFENAIRALRYERRRNAADKHADIFEGQEVKEGTFYLYNVGQKQFLCGGSDWGAHAALGFPGIEINLEESDAELGDFHIETGLYNGENSHYLNYRGYMDAGKGGPWRFSPVEGKKNVYHILQADYPDVHVAWNPYANVDRDQGDETTVGTECRNLDPNDLNAQWKLVTPQERKALLEKASLENPVDATFFIKSPNFNQREQALTAWNFTNATIWDYESGNNHNDYAAESFDTDNCDINTMIEGLPQGVYMASVQAFYRNGNHNDQPNLELSQNAYFYAGNDYEDDTLIPNITAESGKAPGEGNNASDADGSVTYNYPDGVPQATAFFKSGLYKVYTVVEKTDNEDFTMGVAKEEKGEAGDWVVADNFRLTYFGKDTTKEAVRGYLAAIEDIISDGGENTDKRPADNRIYNLLGIPVTNPTVPGVYIQNGKKFIVR